MPVILQKLIATGLRKPEAEILFRGNGTLVRGPSDTGKSYIRDCLWYLLGGEKVPKEIPESKGYTNLYLQLETSENDIYTIKHSLLGGVAEIFNGEKEDINTDEPLSDDVGVFLVGLSGAKGKLVLRSTSKRGPITGGDLRHWSLISQPAMISEEKTTGESYSSRTQRKASFSVFLTGQDDSAVILAQSKDEKLKNKTLAIAIENDLERIKKEVPDGRTKSEIEDALSKVNLTLDILSSQQKERSSELREIRNSLAATISELSTVESKLNQSLLMASRFSLLDEKYVSDLDRLRAVVDGIAVFDALPSQPCLLCGTPIDSQLDSNEVLTETVLKQQLAMEAEAKKIEALRGGLKDALERENIIISELTSHVEILKEQFTRISHQEKTALQNSVSEFSADPKQLAEAKTEYSAQLQIFEEMDRLVAEQEIISKLISTKKGAAIKRQTDVDAVKVGEIVKTLLYSWGFKEINTVDLEAVDCDIKIDGRQRLSYGAGKRAIFLSALIVALMQHALDNGHPHLGVVVLDSPLKSYSDPNNAAEATVSPITVRDLFYDWLSKWTGPGQVIVLENEPVKQDTASRLSPIEFSGVLDKGRAGFYPVVKKNTF
ncbi:MULTISPECIES: hypothetical protein [unclassified Methylophaga]|jgi:hypothetical protein|uniref:hypothetical protein n=1 Tax=unclassified Methylophaga TaxID=2629249 RepID=UPI000C355B33|nr:MULTISPECIES: hypothetical protein [unclassified Methylophaga]MAL49170.1 hypothetical protein [Methylophaga sp.]MAM27409.1 hypothetical protein [Flavobacteriaceae bacterium]MBP24292.1 hypothetical protein [Methylophaga sp.]|tara:strand:- start:4741 stop:6555 length:1815 start_codon:yes stop_codon:yes gene_type:complete